MKSGITIQKENPNTDDAALMISELSACLKDITGDGGQSSFCVDDVSKERAVFVIARNEKGEAVGCGAFRPMEDNTAEIKRMYAKEKGAGIGGIMLSYLETQARNMGYVKICLETRLINHGAVSFYLKNGYRIIPNYGRYIGRKEAVCFEKKL